MKMALPLTMLLLIGLPLLGQPYISPLPVGSFLVHKGIWVMLGIPPRDSQCV